MGNIISGLAVPMTAGGAIDKAADIKRFWQYLLWIPQGSLLNDAFTGIGSLLLVTWFLPADSVLRRHSAADFRLSDGRMRLHFITTATNLLFVKLVISQK